ncbi:hypothetical protein [Micromonospora sp. RTGN7]|uniref:hypothetical protein n=1 Tax=Micromonospora sp. RTGN7 TaxID=3016526 RepID=UPI0029FEEFAE|nr:hypothetical protein [Micromonospora sp. RTGN7]
MLAEHVRDASATAVIFGFFASSWFGWAQEAPPRSWRPVLVVGSVLSLLTAVAAGVLTWRRWSDPTAFDADTSRTFGLIVGIEFAVAALGAGLLALRRRRELIPVWVALVVGVHLFPVAALLDYPLIHVVAALVTAVALAAVPVARARAVPVSAAVGIGAGGVLLAAAVASLVIALVGY